MANKHNIEMPQGEDFRLSITYKDSSGNPVDLTGYTARMMVRQAYTSASPVVSITEQLNEQGQITLGGSEGTILVHVNNETTAGLTPGNGVYDLELVSPGGLVKRLVEGRTLVTPEATK